jgi:hypothetical protein
MGLLLILKNWKESLIGILFAIGAILIGLLKYKSNRLEKVERELKIKEALTKITRSQSKFKAQSLADEQDEILKEIDDVKKSRDSDANSL